MANFPDITNNNAAELVKLLLECRDLVDRYLDQRFVQRAQPLPAQLEASLKERGFANIQDFLDYDRRQSLLEVSRCWEGVNRFTGEKPPLCDLCEGRLKEDEYPDCIRDPKTFQMRADKQACVVNRSIHKDGWRARHISLEEDSIYQAQISAYNNKTALERVKIGVLFSLMDALDWWDYPDHVPPSCVAKVVQVRKPLFDPFWRLTS